ncbi:MAG: hypothetical protein R3B48_06960 [Kofleriaceae bacterium]
MSNPSWIPAVNRSSPRVRGLVVTCTVALGSLGGCGRLAFDSDSGSDNEAALKPSNGATFPAGALAEVELTGVLLLDTDTGQITKPNGELYRAAGSGVRSDISFEMIKMKDESPLSVLAVESLTFRTGSVLQLRRAYPLAILVRGDLVIESGAILDASGGIDGVGIGGPGGGHGAGLGGSPLVKAVGCGGGGNGLADSLAIVGPVDTDGGGAGGSFATVGGDGSEHPDAKEIGRARPSCAAGFEPLLGGSGGGAGGLFLASPLTLLGGVGGGGGGGLQLSAGGRIVVGGYVSVSGGGGGDGNVVPPGGADDWGGGGGGGAGGTLLVEAPVVELEPTSWLTANGGGGGADVGAGAGTVSMTGDPAAGSLGGPVAGGSGCAQKVAATRGKATSDRDGAGGGGGCGAIWILTKSGVAPAANASPVATPGTIATR